MSRRDAILEAIAEANRLHARLKTQELVRSTGGGVDVFATILGLSIPLLFRPLDGLLGAFLPRPSPGIIITTQRGLGVQRFTAAHELGHCELEHGLSLDDDSILHRIERDSTIYDDREAAADAFAVAFLLPEWLFELHAERQGWSAESFDDPHVAYQLSLRVGASYEATCRTLEKYRIIERETLQQHLALTPKKIKQALLGPRALADWNPNVWVLTERDEGTLIQGGPQDVFLIRLKENSGAGYLWNVEDLERSGFTLVSDQRDVPDHSEGVGGIVDRVLVAEAHTEASGRLRLEQARPWDPTSTADRLTLTYELFGNERGLPRAQRAMGAAA